MNILKRLPINFKGELHNVKLINFTVNIDEIRPYVPKSLELFLYNGRALISMVDVLLRNMTIIEFPLLKFSYRHLAFRLLVKDFDGNICVYFLQSFTNKPLLVFGGNLFTHYNLNSAIIKANNGNVEFSTKHKFLKYKLINRFPKNRNEELKSIIGKIDSALLTENNQTKKIQIIREKWPIEWADCESFETNFFQSARYECAFKVNEVIYYQWLAPKTFKLNSA